MLKSLGVFFVADKPVISKKKRRARGGGCRKQKIQMRDAAFGWIERLVLEVQVKVL
jgi:hypothetical protein